MNLAQIRQLPDGAAVPHQFFVQLKEVKYQPDGNKPAKVSLTDASVGQFATVIWRPNVPLVPEAWYEVIPGQDNQGRERVRVQAKQNQKTGKPYVELSIDGSSFFGPVQPPGATNAPPPAQGTSRAGSAPRGARSGVERQGSSALPLAEYQRWWLARWEWYENSLPIQRAISRGEAVARTIRDAIGAEWMSQPPTERDIERTPYRGGSLAPAPPPVESWEPSPGPSDEGDTDIPFSVVLIPLLGALLSGVVG